jgi:PPOX class probable F420-dependent enzyme
MTATLAPARPAASIPISHRDHFERPICAVLTTIGADGRAESSLVWVDLDGDCPRVNTTLERRKARNVAANPRASLLIVDPLDTSRYVQVRGDAELVRDGALEHLDALTRRYTRHPRFYGHVHPLERAAHETRVIVRLRPRRVTVDAIHR